jgi:hypothetical protein
MVDPAPVPLIAVRREYYEAFASGVKTIEYRRHRPPFTARVFYPGRRVRIRCGYGLARPELLATVARFEVKLLADVPRMLGFYPDLAQKDELALIHLEILIHGKNQDARGGVDARRIDLAITGPGQSPRRGGRGAQEAAEAYDAGEDLRRRSTDPHH